MKILLTAFDPFGGESVNPAQLAVERVRETIGDTQIVKVIVPTVFGKSIDTVYSAIKCEKPDAVLCIGQAGGRPSCTPEKVAINLEDARIADNEGNKPCDKSVFPDGPDAFFSTLPVKEMVSEIEKAGVPASVSYSAGTFVCNHLMYGVLYYASKEFPGMRAGFMHVPFIPQQVEGKPGVPSLALNDIVKAIEASVEAIAR